MSFTDCRGLTEVAKGKGQWTKGRVLLDDTKETMEVKYLMNICFVKLNNARANIRVSTKRLIRARVPEVLPANPLLP